jgi:ZIP family zinc transporter
VTLLPVLGIAFIAALLTSVGAPLAERIDVSRRVIGGALQLVAGVITALVAFSLMPPAVQQGPSTGIAIAFFVGGALFVSFEYFSAVRLAAQPGSGPGVTSPGLYVGVLLDVVIDSVLIGIASTLSLATGLLIALAMGIKNIPLTFVTIATAKRKGMSPEHRRLLATSFSVAVMAGAVLGYLVLRHQSIPVRMILIALASGFLISMVTQSLIPEANRDGEPSFAGVLYVAGLSFYGLMSLALT